MSEKYAGERDSGDTVKVLLSRLCEMHVVFVIQSENFFRFIDGTIRELCKDGARVTVITRAKPSLAMLRCQIDTGARVNYGEFAPLNNFWQPIVERSRSLRTYLHWIQPERRHTSGHSMHGRLGAFPARIRWCARKIGLHRFDKMLLTIPGLASLLSLPERLIPADATRVRVLREMTPDAVICLPLIFFPSKELDYFKAAKSLGIPSIGMIASWDNLTTKGIFHVPPDLVLVWNETQRTEAIQLHGLPASKVIPTGAGTFDYWFTSDYKLPEDDFLQLMGLKPGDRYVAYICSSSAAGDEEPIIAELVSALRRSELTRHLQVVVRPHPSSKKRKVGIGIEGVLVWPATGVVPDTSELRRGYFNTLYYASAVVGLSTSGFVEAAILDRPCIAITLESKRYCQWEMPHFNYLVQAGFLATAPSAEQCADQIVELLAGCDSRREASRKFVNFFVRPIQDGRSASRVTADVIKAFIQSRREAMSKECLGDIHSVPVRIG